MKLLHLSDLHIGKRMGNYDLTADQRHVFGQVVGYAKENRPDAILIAGDIYDKAVPSGDSMKLFEEFLMDLRKAAPEAEIMTISGNHDSMQRIDMYRSFLEGQKLHLVGIPPMTSEDHIEKVTLEDEFGKVNFYLLPFIRPSLVAQIVKEEEDEGRLTYDEAYHRLFARESINEAERNILVSHQFFLPAGKEAGDVERMESEMQTVGNIDYVTADVLASFDYAALGHIHKPGIIDNDRQRYSGTPLAYSFSEAEQEKGVVLVELGAKGDVKTQVLPLEPLRQVRIIEGPLAEVLDKACDDYVSVRLTDEPDDEALDMQDRIRSAFPYLVEIRRMEQVRQEAREKVAQEVKDLDPFEQCLAYIGGEVSGEKQDLLRDIINSLTEQGKEAE